ncbi:MAG: MFS transporter [Kyrpidia tusciae]|nr:MFS transporter [Kyrpidia tusciae]MBE3551880.1 MFS transporter [Kyrpidia tusciae]
MEQVRREHSLLDTSGGSEGIGGVRKWLVLANVAVGTFMATLDGSIANVGLPTISETFHVPLASVQWVVTAYLLTICALLPTVGKLSDLLGRGRLYNLGFALFAIGSALCAVSGSVGMLIGMRVVQAVGASFLMANSQGLVATTFGPRERGRALGMIGTTVSLGTLSGPAFGGLLIEHFGWPAIFWVNVPIGAVAFFAGWRILPRERGGGREPFDLVGAGMFAVGITGLLFAVSGAEGRGWTSWPTLGGIGASLLVLVLFYLREVHIPHPMLDFSLYRIRMFSTGSAAAFLSFVSLFCVNVMMPFFIQTVMHQSPAVTGYVMAANPVVMAVTAPLAGWLSDRIGPYVLTTGGLTLNALGFVALNMLSPEVSPWVVAGHLAVFGLGQGLFQSPNNSSIMGSVPRSKVGLAGGLNALTRNLGMVFGISLSVSLFTYRLRVLSGATDAGPGDIGPVGAGGVVQPSPEVFMDAMHTVFWAAAVTCVLGAVVSSLRGGRRTAGGSAKTAE